MRSVVYRDESSVAFPQLFQKLDFLIGPARREHLVGFPHLHWDKLEQIDRKLRLQASWIAATPTPEAPYRKLKEPFSERLTA